jgi:hypothetical protein
LPHAHLVARLKDALDITDQNNEDLINFVDIHFMAELPRFEGEEQQNVYTKMNGESEFTQEYKEKAVEMVRMHNTHKCSISINGCKKDINAECKRGYSRGEIVSETFVNKETNRVVYRFRTKNDLLIVPYNLQMMMDWDSHINVEYSGSAYCALYLYTYCYKGAARKERNDLSPEQEHDSQDEIKLFIYGIIMCSMASGMSLSVLRTIGVNPTS